MSRCCNLLYSLQKRVVFDVLVTLWLVDWPSGIQGFGRVNNRDAAQVQSKMIGKALVALKFQRQGVGIIRGQIP